MLTCIFECDGSVCKDGLNLYHQSESSEFYFKASAGITFWISWLWREVTLSRSCKPQVTALKA